METLKYKIIKSKKQYFEYCDILEQLLDLKKKGKEIKDEIELLTLLIEKWDKEHNSFSDANPIELLQYLMKENNLKAKDLATILDLSKGMVSEILNYNKGMSKEVIRKLAHHFKVSQDAFNKAFDLKVDGKKAA
jgi:HTH-type transcriptional regulator/antitoxin HigA